ncbi:MAG: diguanylate cyclase [Alphaproteobacteria bacterium]|jgi:diguanylate cyclase|nr:diguanylate cyclase [Alphaproteobacteria bacterium]
MTPNDEAGALDHAPDVAASRVELREIVEELDLAAQETAGWLALFHRSAVCKTEPDPGLVVDDAHATTRFGRWYAERRGAGVFDQEAFEALAATHQALLNHVGILARRAWLDEKVPSGEYDALVKKIHAFEDQSQRLARAFRAALSDLDPLTGIQNRANMERELKREQHRALRSGRPCCLALVDIDHFKNVNDTHGHLVGDQVLAAVTRTLEDSLRPYDSIFRFGGEEFLVCLPDTGPEEARLVLERIRKKLRGAALAIGEDQSLSVTISVGIAQMAPRRPVEEITERADTALYLAKEGGRDQVRVWTAELARRP